jgi:hypothetical protein
MMTYNTTTYEVNSTNKITADSDGNLVVNNTYGFSYTTLPSFTSTKIGYLLNTSFNSTPLAPLSTQSYSYSLEVGVWSLQYYVQFRNTLGGATTTPYICCRCFIDTGSAVYAYNSNSAQIIVTSVFDTTPALSSSCIVQLTATTNVYLRIYVNFLGGSGNCVPFGSYQAIRIA